MLDSPDYSVDVRPAEVVFQSIMDMNSYLGEVAGTALLIVLGCGANAGLSLAGSYAKTTSWLQGAVAWGLAVAMSVYAVGEISGAHLNPAVTVGLAFAGEHQWHLVPGYIASQIVGAVLGATLVFLQFIPHWRKTTDPAAKLGVFSTSPAVAHTGANLFSETLGTAVLVFGILAIGANEFTEGLNPLIVGLLITSIGISLGGTTGYAINPARDLGPRIAHVLLPIPGKGKSDWKYAPIPVIGPLFGGSLGALVYQMVFRNTNSVAFWVVMPIFVALIGWAMAGRNASSGEPE